MLLGIWGAFGIGKTFFTRNMLGEVEGDPRFRHVSVVIADQGEEYFMEDDLEWTCRDLPHHEAKRKWAGTQEDKIPFIEDMVWDDTMLWIVESARYFSGMYGCLVQNYVRYGGGIRFIIPLTDGPTMEKFLRDRCAKRNKTFRADYWDARRLEYEARARYANPAKKILRPAGIHCDLVEISASRAEFSRVEECVMEAINLPLTRWYPTPSIKMPGPVKVTA